MSNTLNFKQLLTELYTLQYKNKYVDSVSLIEEYKDYYKNNYEFLTLCGMAYYYTGDYEKSLNSYKRAQTLSKSHENLKISEFNSHFSAMKLEKSMTQYVKNNVYKIVSKERKQKPKLTVTMTSCKRLDLFKQTVNSFIACCTDIHLVDRWICIDDNSSDSDRKIMIDMYPFIEFIFKSPEQKGHAKSMNIIRDIVDTPYMFHLEDDWAFYYKDDYISKLFDVMSTDQKCKQVLVNMHYAEIPQQHSLAGGIFSKTDSGLSFIQHKQCNSSEYKGKATCSYWPHFSFRPSLIETDVLKELGEFSETAPHFEIEYANRYVNKGYVSYFLPYIVSRHIGKLTSQKDGINAYTLNNEEQFVKKKKEYKLEMFYINLDKRSDRKKIIERQTYDMPFDIKRISAVDGKDITLTQQHYLIFKGNDYNYRTGIIGCALSHLSIWINFINGMYTADYLVIFEDDVVFLPHFEDDFSKVCNDTAVNEYDIVFISHAEKHKSIPNYQEKVYITRKNKQESFAMSYGGANAYIISRKGAQGMIDYIEKHRMGNAIDTMMQRACNDLKVGYTNRLLVNSDFALTKDVIDSNIQYDFSSLAKESDVLKEEERMYLIEKGITQVEFGKKNPDAYLSYLYKDFWINISETFKEQCEQIKKERFEHAFYIVNKDGNKQFRLDV